MRDLTKSMMSFSWAMSLFGLRQMTSMLTPRGWDGTASALDKVTHCTEDQLGSATQSFFRAGDNLQRGMVDLMFNMLTFGAGGPNGVRRSVQWGADAMGRVAQAGADAAREGVSSPGSGSVGVQGAQQGDLGWGPMPGGR